MIIALAGAIGSGKSTLANALAAARAARCASFGNYVRHLVGERGLDVNDRTVLQDVGHERVEADARAFLDDTLEWAGHQPTDELVLDGVRHLKILAALQVRAAELNDPTVLVYLGTPVDVRHARVASRGKTLEQILEDERHPAEQDLYQGLRNAADLRLDGGRPVLELRDELLGFLSTR
ncbi:MAG: AAA family ATPase [Phenylobacterium sp.]|uniref:AAA family ATPase n=1 Tax=Phenylobacterium sp. TaxID=1871053 RepID=UPI0025D246C0|nr:AAA family ATPase [Phenylobacterium sp.]MBI1198710.1 AAA family ATPase [Phenylobacterium sp.]